MDEAYDGDAQRSRLGLGKQRERQGCKQYQQKNAAQEQTGRAINGRSHQAVHILFVS
jgi:hypothetical protein